MLTELTSPAYAPFALAFLVMLGVGIIEAVGLGLGHIDADAQLGSVETDTGLLDWLGIGSDLPLLIWLTSFLGCFSLAGVMMQQASTALFGSPLHWTVASGTALVAGLIANRFVAGGIAKIFPGFETTAIAAEDLVMRRGVILEGTARRHHPARAKVVDQFNQAHFIMVEPEYDDDVIATGETALLIRKEGTIFFALPDSEKLTKLIDEIS